MDDPKKVGPHSRHHHPGHPLRAIMQRHRGYLQGHGFRQLATPQCLLFFPSKSVRFLCICHQLTAWWVPWLLTFCHEISHENLWPKAAVRKTSGHNCQALQLYLRKSSEFSTQRWFQEVQDNSHQFLSRRKSHVAAGCFDPPLSTDLCSCTLLRLAISTGLWHK